MMEESIVSVATKRGQGKDIVTIRGIYGRNSFDRDNHHWGICNFNDDSFV